MSDNKLQYYRPVSIISDRPASSLQDLWGTYSWRSFLTDIAKRPNNVNGTVDRCCDVVVPVECFQHAPFRSHTKHYANKVIMVEAPVPKEYVSTFNVTKECPAFWFATVLKIAGYRMLLRYVGLDQEEGKVYDFWISMGSTDLKHIGYCSEDFKTRRLIVPDMVNKKQKEWDNYALSQIHARHSIAFNWPGVQTEKMYNCKFQVGTRVELLDTVLSKRVRPARITKIVGHRVYVTLSKGDVPPERVSDEDDQIDGVWLEHDSPLLFYVGWSTKVGYGLYATEQYKAHAEQIAEAMALGIHPLPLDKLDAHPDLFKMFKETDGDENVIEWEKGMRMEVLDPADTYRELRSGTVLELLADGYLKIGFKGEVEDEDPIPLHCSSPLLFPVGYAEKYGLKLKGPGDKHITSHVSICGGKAAPVELFDPVEDYVQEMAAAFKIGAKLEAADMCDAQLICPASIAALRGRILEINYDGWDSSYNQLFEFRSNDIFPLGWCEMYGYKFENPKNLSESPKKRRPKGSKTFWIKKKPKA